jgi:hypothetical protein
MTIRAPIYMRARRAYSDPYPVTRMQSSDVPTVLSVKSARILVACTNCRNRKVKVRVFFHLIGFVSDRGL